MKRMLRFNSAAIIFAMVIVLFSVGTADAALKFKQKVGRSEYKFQLYGFSQLELRGGDGQSDEGGIFFKAQRIRIGTKYFFKGWFGKLFLDFNQSHSSSDAGLPKMIKDAFVGYKFSHAAFIRMGMIKIPHGMGFTIPGWNLDNIERSALDKGLVMERGFGVMLSGRFIGGDQEKIKKMPNGTEMGHEKVGYGFGYDIGIFNPAGRSKVVVWDKNQLGDALATAARVHYDHGKAFHGELSWAKSQDAGGCSDTEKSCLGNHDYTSIDLGLHSMIIDDRLDLKLEYITGENLKGEQGWDQDCLTLTAGWMFHPQIEGVIKHYIANADRESSSSDRSNTYVGVNFFIKPLKLARRTLQSHRIQVNYVLGDDADWYGVGGYSDDSYIMQWQLKY